MIIQTEDGAKLQLDDGSTPTQIDDVISHYKASQQSFPQDAPNMQYGSVLPLARNTQTGDMSFAAPEMIRSPARGIWSLMQRAAGQEQPATEDNPDPSHTLSQDEIGALTMISPTSAATSTSNLVRNAANGLQKGANATGDALVNSAQNSRLNFAHDLVSPSLDTKTARIDAVPNTTTTGLLNKKVLVPTQQETESAQNVASIPEVSQSNTIQQNYNAINNAKNAEAQKLRSTLQQSNSISDPAKFNSKLDVVLANLKQDPLIVGDAETTATRVVNKMQDLVNQNEPTPAGLLQARQQFDAWAQGKKTSVFDSNQNAFSTAVSATRQAANNALSELVPDAGVKTSLAYQSSLYRAMDNIAPKAAQEPATAIGRAAKNISDAIPVKNPIVKGAIETGVGAVGLGAAYSHPAIGAALTALYGATKVLSNPALRMAVGKILGGQLDNATASDIVAAAQKVAPEEMKMLPAPGRGVLSNDEIAQMREQIENPAPKTGGVRVGNPEDNPIPTSQSTVRDPNTGLLDKAIKEPIGTAASNEGYQKLPWIKQRQVDKLIPQYTSNALSRAQALRAMAQIGLSPRDADQILTSAYQSKIWRK